MMVGDIQILGGWFLNSSLGFKLIFYIPILFIYWYSITATIFTFGTVLFSHFVRSLFFFSHYEFDLFSL